ncbi:MAG: hypothetical protein HOV81_05730 [Kofleriaceae bacterium]|nr:hypothetical protein [Kofleriaceae bacterium]
MAGIAGCPGAAPDDQNAQPDAPTADGQVTTALMLSGTVMDYFGATAVQDAMVATDGLEPPRQATSATDGKYEVEVAVGSKVFLLASKTAYRTTRNSSVDIGDMPVTQDIYVMAEQDVRNQYTAVGALPTAGTAIVIADLRRNNNMPLDGIPLTNIQLLDANNQPVATAKGPFGFNAGGSVDQAATTVTTYSGKARIAYLDVPPGTYTLAVTYLNGMNQNTTMNTSLTTAADGGTLLVAGGMGGGGGGDGGGGGAVTDPSFATHIYPKLQRAGAGGLGCANCHTLTGPAAVLKYDEAPGTVLASITARPGVINATTPADSLILKRPLYEAPPLPQDHPNATFLDVNDADYKLFLLWIEKGAKP